MKDFPTPHRDHSKSSDLINRKSHLKKPQKIPKKSLNGLFTSVSDDITPDHQLSDQSPLSEITEVSASSEIFPPEDVTPIFKSVSETNGNAAVERFGLKNVEADVVVSLLKQARIEVINSADVDFKLKEVLDALIELVIIEYNSCAREKERCTKFVSVKIPVVALCFAIWCVVVSGILFLNEGLNNYSYGGRLPT